MTCFKWSCQYGWFFEIWAFSYYLKYEIWFIKSLRFWDQAILWDMRFAFSYSLRFEIVRNFLLFEIWNCEILFFEIWDHLMRMRISWWDQTPHFSTPSRITIIILKIKSVSFFGQAVNYYSYLVFVCKFLQWTSPL